MSGEREIRDTADALSKRDLRHTEILPLYARLSNSEQNRVPGAQRASHRAGDQRGGNLADRTGH
jgi:HrpA-like RNA helicase